LALKQKQSILAGAIAGVIGVIIWNFILENPAGLDGLIIGLF